MNIKIGTDIESVSRFENLSETFLNKCFHKSEIEYCKKHKYYAQNLCGRFCAKEAFAKAMGLPQEWHDVEILNDDKGKPIIILHGKAKEALKGAKTEVSISHCSEYATATVIIYIE
ncbi:MAG: holo-ACP synthase [Abditibacteriota bacterium]|nr:holo-ACP synthase [Abditibacteriota bacterium]